MRKPAVLGVGVTIVILALSAVFLIQRIGGSRILIAPQTFVSDVYHQGPAVTIGSTRINVQVSRTKAEVEQGLSGRVSLPSDSGMLFAFAEADIYHFWMPNMYFPLDMIWINKGKVVDISADVSNDFDPMKPKFYTPKEPAQYVLEVNAGFASNHKIRIGDSVKFTDI